MLLLYSFLLGMLRKAKERIKLAAVEAYGADFKDNL